VRFRGHQAGMPLAFDAFGTLFDLEWLREDAGDELYEHFYARLQPWTWLATAGDVYVPLPELAAQAFESAAAELGTNGDAGALAQKLTELPLFPDVEPALDALSDERLGVLSNGTRDGLEQMLTRTGIRDRFQHVLVADQVKRYKPAPEVYALAPKAFGLHADEITLVSGNAWDVAGAKLAGLHAVWVSRGRPLAPVLGIPPDDVVEDLTGLAGLR
jgi:2-haloacid dehalogenase